VTRPDAETLFALLNATAADWDGRSRTAGRWVGFKSMWDTTEQKTNDQIEQIGG
jgi:hypothetical protein